MCQKSLNFTYALKCYQQKCKWLHFSWATLYILRVSVCKQYNSKHVDDFDEIFRGDDLCDRENTTFGFVSAA